jgi:hypothetical protein
MAGRMNGNLPALEPMKITLAARVHMQKAEVLNKPIICVGPRIAPIRLWALVLVAIIDE